MSTTEARLTLGIRRLPLASGALHPGGIYALSCESLELARPLVNGMVDDAREQLQPVTVVLGPESIQWGDQLPRRGAGTASGRSHLHLFARQARSAEEIGATHASQLAEELEYFGASGSLIILVEAGALFPLSDGPGCARRLRWLRNWASENFCPVVMLFAGDDVRTSQITPLQSAGAGFAGIATLSCEHNQAALQLETWHGITSSELAYLREAEDQAYELRPELAARNFTDPSQLNAANDRDRVYATRAAVRGESGIPATWSIVENEEVLLSRTDSITAATCLLGVESTEHFPALARAVFELRRRIGSGVKIVVREGGRRLRTAQSLLLLKVGANAVIDAETPMTRVLTGFEALRDQLFLRPLPDQIEPLLDSVQPPEEKGYHPPEQFRAACLRALKKAQQNSVECALARLFLLPDVRLEDALAHCHMRRSGDLFSADNRSIYVFLYGCWEQDVNVTLQRIFRLPIPELFIGHIEHTDAAAIQRELSVFHEYAERLSLPSFSSIAAAATPAQPASDPSEADGAPPETGVPPRRVTPAPMTLRVPAA
ncbi:MAG: cellulose biosynthesis protein BcsE [Nevskiales bacterium]|nr:cellulose biosynthesis protein BcsE [Nevskiales bacterium]